MCWRLCWLALLVAAHVSVFLSECPATILTCLRRVLLAGNALRLRFEKLHFQTSYALAVPAMLLGHANLPAAVQLGKCAFLFKIFCVATFYLRYIFIYMVK
jgi:hypothetical protein